MAAGKTIALTRCIFAGKVIRRRKPCLSMGKAGKENKVLGRFFHQP